MHNKSKRPQRNIKINWLTFLLQVKVCTSCGSLLSTRISVPENAKSFHKYREYKARCVVCDSSERASESSVATLQVYLLNGGLLQSPLNGM